MPDPYWPNKATEEAFFWMNASEHPIRNTKRLILEEGKGYAAGQIKALLANQLLTNLKSAPDFPQHFSNSQELLRELVEIILGQIDYQFLAEHMARADVAPWCNPDGSATVGFESATQEPGGTQ